MVDEVIRAAQREALKYRRELTTHVLRPHRVWLELEARAYFLRWEALPDRDSLRGEVRVFAGVRPEANLAVEFGSLAQATVKQVEDFCRKYGCLCLVPDGRKELVPWSSLSAKGLNLPMEGKEHLKHFRRHVRKIAAILNIAVALKQGETGGKRDWAWLVPFQCRNGAYERGTKRERRMLIQYHVLEETQKWLDRGGVRMSLDWNRDRGTRKGEWIQRWRTTTHWNLYGMIGIHLVQAICEGTEEFCEGCKRLYFRREELRRPNPGSASYCDGCREDGVPQKKADERRRSRYREIAALFRQGHSKPVIAERLEVPIRTVESALKRLGVCTDGKA